MKFSVLMSLYIKENPLFLAESLKSLMKQSYPADEVVLVLDGPITSELQQVIEEFNIILPLKVIPLEKNIGLGKSIK